MWTTHPRYVEGHRERNCSLPRRTAPPAAALLAAAVTTGVLLAPTPASAFTLTTTVADRPLSFTIDGFVGAYYSFVFTDPENGISNARLFASRHNAITVSGASIGLELRYAGAFLYVAPWFGHVPANIYAGEPEAAVPDAASVGPSDSSVWRYLRAANAGFEIDGWKVDAGLFVSPIGLEGVAEKDNWLWSSSWQNYFFPFYHFGARVHYTTPGGNTLGLWVVNGLTGATDTNDAKSIIVTASGAVGDGQWQVLYYGGIERPDDEWDVDLAWLHQLDAWIMLPVTSWLEIAFQTDVGFEPSELGVAYYLAASGYARFTFCKYASVAVRLEAFHEELTEENDIATSSPYFFDADWVASGSIAFEVRPVPNTAVRLEYRRDQADEAFFFNDTDELTERSQDAVTLGLTVWL